MRGTLRSRLLPSGSFPREVTEEVPALPHWVPTLVVLVFLHALLLVFTPCGSVHSLLHVPFGSVVFLGAPLNLGLGQIGALVFVARRVGVLF